MAGRIEISEPSDDTELRAYAQIVWQSFGRGANPEEVFERMRGREHRVVRRSGRVIGGLGLQRTGQWFGGRSVPMGGILAVGIAPDQRAGGTATALMRAVLEELHGGGVAISTLYPATQPLYRRVGYEQAGVRIGYKLPLRSIDVRDRTLDVWPVEGPDDGIRAVYTQRAAGSSGHLDRTVLEWTRVFEPNPDAVHGYAVGRDGAAQGYVVFTQRRDRSWRYDLHARDLCFVTPQAGWRLLTFLADHRSLAENVTWVGPPNDPLLLLTAEQEYELDGSFAWMLRIVDVRGALAARGWPQGLDAEIHLEVQDGILPWNDGRFVLEVAGGRARVRKGGRGRVRLTVRGLAALYSGYMTPAQLQGAGMLDAQRKDLRASAAAFAAPMPWLPDFF